MNNLPIVAGVAGAPLAQRSSAVDRARQAANLEARRNVADQRAEQAEGIGELDAQQQSAEDRHPDGRQPWQPAASQSENAATGSAPAPRSIDADRGNLIDLAG